MTTIRERIREEVRAILTIGCSAEVLERALFNAEKRGREEAAKIAENCVPHGVHPDDLYRWRQTADTLAAAIRSTS